MLLKCFIGVSTEEFNFSIGLDFPRCLQPNTWPDRPVCYGYFPRYYFDRETTSCQQFIYGGCNPTGNNFQTKARCENTCKVGTVERYKMGVSRICPVIPKLQIIATFKNHFGSIEFNIYFSLF